MTPVDPAITDLLATWESISMTAVTEERLAVNHCVLACKTLIVALDDLGYDAIAWPVQTIVTNRAARELIAAKVPHTEWPPHAWRVLRLESGHLILTVDEHLIDPTAHQFQRPGRLNLPNILITNADEFRTTGHTAATGPDGTTIEWWHDRKLGNLHRNSPDWTRNWRIYHQQLNEALSHNR